MATKQNLGVWTKVYNNTVYNTTTNLISWKFYNCDSLDFRNNIVYAPNCWVALGIDYYTESQATYINIDYNQYELDAVSSFAYMQEIWEKHPLGTPKTISWNIWKTRMIADRHSEANSGIYFVEGNELSPSSYKLNAGTTGVDEGVTIPL